MKASTINPSDAAAIHSLPAISRPNPQRSEGTFGVDRDVDCLPLVRLFTPFTGQYRSNA